MFRVGCSRLMVTTDGHGRGWTCVVDWPAELEEITDHLIVLTGQVTSPVWDVQAEV